VREKKERNEQGHTKVKVNIICYLQLAHLLFEHVSELTNMEEKHFKTTVP
jgi:hypothetical protein